MITLWIAFAGSLGAVSRFVLDGVVRSRSSAEFPWATAIVNVTGSLILGVVTGAVLFHGTSPEISLILGVGFCGGYTTFSTATFETVRLIQRQRYWLAVGNTIGTVTFTLLAGAAGLAIAAL